MTAVLRDLKNDIVSKLNNIRRDREFDLFLTSLLNDINALSTTHRDARVIVEKMFWRLNHNEDGTLIERPFDDRWTSPDFQRYMPIAMAITDLAGLIEIMRAQVHVYTATGRNLDDLGRDHDFPRFEATRAIRIGFTLDTQGVMADFPLGSPFMTRHEHTVEHGHRTEALIFRTIETDNGNVLYECDEYGDVGNTYFGDLSPAGPINGLGRATITDTAGAFRPGQNRESDEDYRRRFLLFLRHRAFGGNVAQYMQEVMAIDGIGNLMVFAVWRGGGTSHVVIVDTNNYPVSDEFVEFVNNEIDPVVRGGAGIGFAPIGHRVTVSTPEWFDVNINIRVVLAPSVDLSMVDARMSEILAQYMSEVRASVFTEWDRTLFDFTTQPPPVRNAWADLQSEVSEHKAFVSSLADISGDDRQRLLAFATMAGQWFPAEASHQTHNFFTTIHPQVVGLRLLETGLILAVDLQNLMINGDNDPNGLRIPQSEQRTFIPRLNNFDVEAVDYIEPATPPIQLPLGALTHKTFVTAFDMPVGHLSEVSDD